MKRFIHGIEEYVDRIIVNIQESDNSNKEQLCCYFENIKKDSCHSFDEAIQRILFYNQLQWQFGHRLIGLGRLDLILDSYYVNDIKNNVLSKKQVKELLKEFCLLLNQDYIYKSSSLLGDTGQLIILGGLDINNDYFQNDLTSMFIDVISEIQKPDPKLLLRVSKNMDKKLLDKAIKCISTGVGSPLLSNDDQIIEKLIDFGYDKIDAYNYCASACWEPLIPGKSLDPNNLNRLNFLKPFNEIFDNKISNDMKYEDIEKVYFKNLKKYIDDVVENTNSISFDKSNILSLLIDDCLDKNIDISEGGAKYNNYGLTTVGLSNVVNSLLNLDKYVYQEKRFSLTEFNEMRLNNYDDSTISLLKNNEMKFGLDDDKVIELTNKIIKEAGRILSKKKNIFNGRYKFGLSSPAYISLSNETNASFDGRRSNEPYSVHISSMNNSFIELIQFASKLDYNDNRFNGNVIDFIVDPYFINKNFDKFSFFIYKSIENGFFQMQMNVVSSKMLIDAKNNPEKFPNLIVRVWGFSAYFNELPEEYKNLLIERALKSESHSY